MARENDPIETRFVSAWEVLDTFDVRKYPHRYVVVSGGQGPVQLLTAVELLEEQDWELVNMTRDETYHAVMRRVRAQ